MSRPKGNTDKNSTFSSKEIEQYGKRNISFIKGIQKSEKLNKKDAIKLFNQKKKGKPSDFKRFQRKVKKSAFTYGQIDVSPSGEVTQKKVRKLREHKKPTVKTQKPKTSLSQWRKQQKKALNDYLQSVKYRDTPTYQKVKSGHKIYPDASKYELSHGINSKASREYRIKHGLTPEYKGRVKK